MCIFVYAFWNNLAMENVVYHYNGVNFDTVDEVTVIFIGVGW